MYQQPKCNNFLFSKLLSDVFKLWFGPVELFLFSKYAGEFLRGVHAAHLFATYFANQAFQFILYRFQSAYPQPYIFIFSLQIFVTAAQLTNTRSLTAYYVTVRAVQRSTLCTFFPLTACCHNYSLFENRNDCQIIFAS